MFISTKTIFNEFDKMVLFVLWLFAGLDVLPAPSVDGQKAKSVSLFVWIKKEKKLRQKLLLLCEK